MSEEKKVKKEEVKSTKEEIVAESKNVVSDDALIEDVDYSKDDAPVEVIYRCKKCGQILAPSARDCWKCSSTEIEEVVEEETKEVKKMMLQARCERLEHDIKELKKTNNLLFFLIVIVIAVLCIYMFTR